jgi:hypothetical protein
MNLHRILFMFIKIGCRNWFACHLKMIWCGCAWYVIRFERGLISCGYVVDSQWMSCWKCGIWCEFSVNEISMWDHGKTHANHHQMQNPRNFQVHLNWDWFDITSISHSFNPPRFRIYSYYVTNNQYHIRIISIQIIDKSILLYANLSQIKATPISHAVHNISIFIHITSKNSHVTSASSCHCVDLIGMSF